MWPRDMACALPGLRSAAENLQEECRIFCPLECSSQLPRENSIVLCDIVELGNG